MPARGPRAAWNTHKSGTDKRRRRSGGQNLNASDFFGFRRFRACCASAAGRGRRRALQLVLNYFALDPHLTFSTRKQTAAPVVCDRQASPAATAAAHGPQPRAPSRCAKLKPPQWHLSRRCKICATVAIGGSRRRCGGLPLAHGATAAACAGQPGRKGLGCSGVQELSGGGRKLSHFFQQHGEPEEPLWAW